MSPVGSCIAPTGWIANIRSVLSGGSSFARSSFVVSLFIGVTARLVLPFRGHNFDVESYKIVAEIRDAGGNVYAETSRYNYGPVWFYVLDAIDTTVQFAGGGNVLFRHAVAWFLVGVDVALAVLLAKRFNWWVGVAVLLNPVSMIITGYHSQFDNLAVLLAFAGVVLVFPRQERARYEFWLGLLLLGTSLATKHVFVILPFWLALRPLGRRDRALMLTGPYLVFVGSFFPYWAVGREGIIANVIEYRSFANAPLLVGLTWFNPSHELATVFLLFALGVAGFATMQCRPEFSLGVYTVVVVAFSPAIANQYLAVPVSGIAILGIGWFLPYVAVATYHLVVDGSGLGLAHRLPTPFTAGQLYVLSTIFLASGLMARFAVPRFRRRYRRLAASSMTSVDAAIEPKV